MPIYEYQCTACQHSLEALQKIADAPLTQCPKCEEISLRKCLSKPGLQFKGEGWYVTDYKSKPTDPAAKPDKPADSKNAENKTAASKDSSSKAVTSTDKD